MMQNQKKPVKSHQVNFKILAGFGHLELLFWRILAIWNHCEAEAATEAALDIAGDEVHAWSYYNEIYRSIILRKSLFVQYLIENFEK